MNEPTESCITINFKLDLHQKRLVWVFFCSFFIFFILSKNNMGSTDIVDSILKQGIFEEGNTCVKVIIKVVYQRS